MRRVTLSLLLLVAVPCLTFAQSQSQSRPPQKLVPDRFGMTCAQILRMSSAEWIAYFNDKAHIGASDASTGLTRAIAVYGKCYDTRTDALASALAKSGKGPLMGARGDFRDFEAALKDFAAKALADATVPPDEKKLAFSALYEKQFRYEFYLEYEARTIKPIKPAGATAKPPASSAPPAAVQTPAVTGPASPSATGSAATAQERARSDADPVTQAKNRFGKLLEVLPDDKMHELHRSFGDVIGPYQISEATRLAVYRYAIFLLEPPSATPQSHPPF
jgi:hypothetical protein